VQNPWRQRIWHEFHADNLTRAYRDVLLTLATYGPRPWPSHETLATRARCCVRTVQRALQAAQDLGLVSWVERRVRAGWRWLRTSNRYTLTLSGEPVRTTGQRSRGGEIGRKKPCLMVGPAFSEGAVKALAAIAARRMVALGLAP
jgi:hypothetical protein